MNQIVLSLGSNLGNRKNNLTTALQNITENGFLIEKQSHIMESRPYGETKQGYFLNMTILAFTPIHNPFQALLTLQSIENRMGRKRISHWGPRNIDIDILFWNQEIIQSNNLTIPHDDLQNRVFVLFPLLEIIPNYHHPVLNTNISMLWNIYKNKNHDTIKKNFQEA